MRVQFWGTRGSIAKPGPSTTRYGGNTSCLEVRSARGTLVIIDCGTGGHSLGQKLMSGHAKGLRGNILISHTHWDHIQGIPFFAPLFSHAVDTRRIVLEYHHSNGRLFAICIRTSSIVEKDLTGIFSARAASEIASDALMSVRPCSTNGLGSVASIGVSA